MISEECKLVHDSLKIYIKAKWGNSRLTKNEKF